MDPKLAAQREINVVETPISEVPMGPWQIAFRKFIRNKLAVLGVFLLIVIFLTSLAAPMITPLDPEKSDMLNTNGKPDDEHLLGTDGSGRDNFARLLYGARVSLTIGFFAMVLTVTLGTLLGSLAGYYGGKVDDFIMRLCDLMLNFPFLLFVLTVIAILEKITIAIFIAVLAVTSWAGITRIIRGTFLSLREQEFILSAQSIGCSDFRIIWKHFLPNAMGPIIVNATLFMAGIIITESALSFLGFGIPQPTPTWGNMLSEALALRVLKYQPWQWIPPGVAILITVLSINFIGDGLRDALDPRARQD
jgi:peptide/nickel transport system permease protein